MVAGCSCLSQAGPISWSIWINRSSPDRPGEECGEGPGAQEAREGPNGKARCQSGDLPGLVSRHHPGAALSPVCQLRLPGTRPGVGFRPLLLDPPPLRAPPHAASCTQVPGLSQHPNADVKIQASHDWRRGFHSKSANHTPCLLEREMGERGDSVPGDANTQLRPGWQAHTFLPGPMGQTGSPSSASGAAAHGLVPRHQSPERSWLSACVWCGAGPVTACGGHDHNRDV